MSVLSYTHALSMNRFISYQINSCTVVWLKLLTMCKDEHWDNHCIYFKVLCLIHKVHTTASHSASFILCLTSVLITQTFYRNNNQLLSFRKWKYFFTTGVRWFQINVSLEWPCEIKIKISLYIKETLHVADWNGYIKPSWIKYCYVCNYCRYDFVSLQNMKG